MSTIEWILTAFNIAVMSFTIFNGYLTIKRQARQPFEKHEERISALEKDVADIHREMNEANDRIGDLEKGTTILIRSMGALLSHGIEGNNTSEMIAVREELNTYLSDRFNK